MLYQQCFYIMNSLLLFFRHINDFEMEVLLR